MLFPTFNFLLFFLVVLGVAWALRDLSGPRKWFLIAASYFFYGYWDWRFTALLLASSLINYTAGRLVERGGALGLGRKGWLAAAVVLNLGILGFFKYYGFFMRSLQDVLLAVGWERDMPLLEVILPVGISFFTFQGISYVADVYRQKIAARRDLGDVMLYISFFPQLVAGPIVRASDFLPQLDRKPDANRVLMSFGLLLIVWGLFKKQIVANYLAIDLADKTFFDAAFYSGGDLLLGVYAYAVQIYCDFSAYSDIAIGVAALLGYRFQRNFDQPYRSRSIAEFWRRWHISLSSWLRDYLYIPLGGNRNGRLKTYRNLMLTMLLGGLWHGAAWNFVIWGALHGGALGLERAMRGAWQSRRALIAAPEAPRPVIGSRLIATLLVFHFVCFCWIFFRAENMTIVGDYLTGLADWSGPIELATPLNLSLIVLGLAIHFTPRNTLNVLERGFDRIPFALQGFLAGFAVAVIEAFGMDSAAPFIYFQF